MPLEICIAAKTNTQPKKGVENLTMGGVKRPYGCGEDGCYLDSDSTLQYSWSMERKELADLRCPACPAFLFVDSLEAHWRAAHIAGSRRWVCGSCIQDFPSFDQAAKHCLLDGAVAEYVPPLVESEEEAKEEVDRKDPKAERRRTRGAGVKYVDGGRRFPDPASAYAWLETSDYTTKSKHPSKAKNNLKIYLRCKFGKAKARLGKPCPRKALLHQHADDSVTLLVSEADHCHEGLGPRIGLPAEMKERIKELWAEGIREPRHVTAAFRTLGLEEPSLRQLANFSAYHRPAQTAQADVAELRGWCEGKDELPDDPDTPYVAYQDLAKRRLFITTRRLLGQAEKAEPATATLALDTTYGLNRPGLPVHMAGLVDADKVCHPLGLAVSETEKGGDYEFLCRALAESVLASTGRPFAPAFLLADEAPAITQGAESVFRPHTFLRITCWFHVAKKIRKATQRLPSPMGEELYERIRVLQRSRSWEELRVSWALLKREYERLHEDNPVHHALKVIEKDWLCPERRNWYEGAAPACPSTNNALEALNRLLQADWVLRGRPPLPEFLSQVSEAHVGKWSLDRAPSCPTPKAFAVLPSLGRRHWEEANAYAHQARPIIRRTRGQESLLYVRAEGGPLALEEEVLRAWEERAERRAWADWAAFARDRQAFWTVRLRGEDWRRASCTCPAFQKSRVCAHSLGVPIRIRLPGLSVPPEFRRLPVGGRRAPGRPRGPSRPAQRSKASRLDNSQDTSAFQ